MEKVLEHKPQYLVLKEARGLMKYEDLRQWINEMKKLGELREIDGANWDLEIGAITRIGGPGYGAVNRRSHTFLFDNIIGYPKGCRVLSGVLNSERSLAFTLGIPPDLSTLELVRAIKKRFSEIRPIPPRKVTYGPVLENVRTGKDINIYEFPTPKWNELDGGRYFGTGDLVITRDPDEGWVNLGTYRIMIHDEKTLGFYISPGRHGRIHREKYFSRGQSCKVAISAGEDPLLYLLSTSVIPYGLSEYDLAGGIKGEPVEVIEGEYTGLPIPAHAEIAIEGEALPGKERTEGPFAEWTGYYASGVRPEPIINIKKIMFRNDPIMMGPSRRHQLYMKSAFIWDQLEKAGVPDVRGVWLMEEGRAHLILVIAIKQRYPGHAKQAALVGTACHAGAYTGRYTIVVDEDIDPTNTSQVLEAVATRSDPRRSIEIVDRCWSTALDPAIPIEDKGLNSRAIIDACRPYEWKDAFPPEVKVSESLRQSVIAKWGDKIFS